jgi:hypothetical protein
MHWASRPGARPAACLLLTAMLAVLLDGRLTERIVVLRPSAPAAAFTLRSGELSPAAPLPTDGASTPLDD